MQAIGNAYIQIDDDENAESIWRKLFWKIGENKTARYDYSPSTTTWDLKRTQSWVDKLRQNGAQPQPGPGDSQETKWQDGDKELDTER